MLQRAVCAWSVGFTLIRLRAQHVPAGRFVGIGHASVQLKRGRQTRRPRRPGRPTDGAMGVGDPAVLAKMCTDQRGWQPREPDPSSGGDRAGPARGGACCLEPDFTCPASGDRRGPRSSSGKSSARADPMAGALRGSGACLSARGSKLNWSSPAPLIPPPGLARPETAASSGPSAPR